MYFGCDLLFREYGIEIWKKHDEYLVLDKFNLYGKFYKTFEEAANDEYLRRRLYGVIVKRDDNPLK